MLEKEPASLRLSACSEEEGASSASLYTLLYTYIFCAEIKQSPSFRPWRWKVGPTAGKELSPDPLPPHPTRGLRRCFLRTSTGGAEGKHPKRREFRLSLWHINTTIYACTPTHSQPYAHAYTHTNQNNSSKSFKPFFPQSTTNSFMDTDAKTTRTFASSASLANRPRWTGGGGGWGGSSSIPNKGPFYVV